MIHYVYQTTNLTNGKKYIGKHSTKVYNSYLGSGTALLLAIEKYGSENFKKEILSIHNTSELAYEAEKLIIEQLNARLSKDYYNIAPGGKGGKFNIVLTEEHKEKISKSSKGRKLSKETREKMSRARKGKPSWHKGRKKSDEFKKKISKIKKGMVVSKETREKISKSSSGKNNSNYGKRWITDGTNNKKIVGTDSLPEGWKYGRNVKHIKGFRGSNIKKEK